MKWRNQSAYFWRRRSCESGEMAKIIGWRRLRHRYVAKMIGVCRPGLNIEESAGESWRSTALAAPEKAS
jgi:hypothetical protein